MLLRKPALVAVVTIIAVFCPSIANLVGNLDSIKTNVESGRTLFLIVEATLQNAPAIQDLATDFTSLVFYIDPKWFNDFVVILFDSTGITFTQRVYTVQQFEDLVTTLSGSMTSNNGCDLPLLEVFLHGLSSFTFNPESQVFLITTAGSSVSDQVNGPTFFKASLGWQVQLQYLLINSTACNNTLDSQSTRFVANLAVTTGGYFAEIESVRTIEHIFIYMNMLYYTKVIASPTQGSFLCANTIYYLAIEKNVGTIFLSHYSVYSLVSNPTIKGPQSTIHMTEKFVTSYNQLYSFFPIDGPGIYTISLNASGACNVQIRAHILPEPLATTVGTVTNTPPSIFYSTPLPTTAYYNKSFDISVVLDNSIDVSLTQSADLINLFLNTLSYFNLNGNINMMVDATCNDGGLSNYFTPIHDTSDLDKFFSAYVDYNCTESHPSALTDILSNLYDVSFQYDNGYRLNRNIIVYATINGIPDSIASTMVNLVTSSGAYTMIVVAYESDGNTISALTHIFDSHCVITAQDYNELTTTTTRKLADLINAIADFNSYC